MLLIKVAFEHNQFSVPGKENGDHVDLPMKRYEKTFASGGQQK